MWGYFSLLYRAPKSTSVFDSPFLPSSFCSLEFCNPKTDMFHAAAAGAYMTEEAGCKSLLNTFQFCQPLQVSIATEPFPPFNKEPLPLLNSGPALFSKETPIHCLHLNLGEKNPHHHHVSCHDRPWVWSDVTHCLTVLDRHNIRSHLG